jgi:hypothetical protein
MFQLHNPVKSDDLQYYTVTSHPCPTCNTTVSINITPDKLYAYNQGAYAQEVLSKYHPGIRERFISGMCDPCWSELYDDDADWDDE